MKKEKFISVIFVLIISFGINIHLCNSDNNSIQEYRVVKLNISKTILGLEEHNPILIDSNDDFETLNFTGEGTELEPYIIANLYINASGTTNGIEIHNTGVHFEIRNCTIETDYIGILLSAVAASTSKIIDNFCVSKSGDGGGIGLSGTYGCNITDNECAYFMQGIHLNNAHNNIITNNIIPVSNYQGINIRYSNYNEITYNRIQYSQQHGLAFVGTAHDNIIHHNTFINNSLVDEYLIDGERSGAIGSQGYNEGSNNIWYDEDGKYGNSWSDYNGRGSYSIDGPADAKDSYPLELTYTEGSPISIVTILTSIVAISIYYLIHREKKSKY